MIINSEIFNEARNINSDVIDAMNDQFSGDGDVVAKAEYALSELYCPAVFVDEITNVDPDDYHHALEAEGTGAKYQALSDTLGNIDPICDFLDNGGNLWFIPGNSLLYNALRSYFGHLTGSYDFKKNGAKFIRSFHWGHDEKDNAGFYMATGTGYDINDEFFAGVPSTKQVDQGVGSGIPTKRFLDYINSDVKKSRQVK